MKRSNWKKLLWRVNAISFNRAMEDRRSGKPRSRADKLYGRLLGYVEGFLWRRIQTKPTRSRTSGSFDKSSWSFEQHGAYLLSYARSQWRYRLWKLAVLRRNGFWRSLSFFVRTRVLRYPPAGWNDPNFWRELEKSYQRSRTM